jgi:hypothetical protein
MGIVAGIGGADVGPDKALLAVGQDDQAAVRRGFEIDPHAHWFLPDA